MPLTKVTPAERSGGYKVGVIAASVFNTTGIKSITGLGFKPKMVRFTTLTDGSGYSNFGHGSMDETGGQFAIGGGAWGGAGAGQNVISSTSRCILFNKWQTTTTPFISASYSSMDADGFSINVNVGQSDPNSLFSGVAYEAFG